MPAVNYWWLHLKPNLEIDGTGITKVGTIGTGEWRGTAIADAYVANDITLTNITQITTKSHTSLSDIGSNSHSTIDTHIADGNKHFLEGAIDHVNIGSIGSNAHSVIDTHLGAANPHSGSAPSAHSHLDAEVDNGITLTNITQITTKSHTSLSDIGSNAHSVIDTHLGAANPHSGSAPSAHSHLDAEVDNGITLTNITQITTRSHTSLSNIGTNAHSVIDSHLSAAHLGAAGISSYVHKVPAAHVSGFYVDANLIQQAFVSFNSTTNETLVFTFAPPDWLSRYAEVSGKTITCTTITINWSDLHSSTYIDRIRAWWTDGDAATTTAKLDDGTNHGSGSAAFRNTVCNITDTAMSEGDNIYLRLDIVQNAANNCRVHSFEITYTLA